MSDEQAPDDEPDQAAFVAAVEAGLADLEAGRVHTHAEVREAMAARFGGPIELHWQT